MTRPVKSGRSVLLHVCAVATGVLVWEGVRAASGMREAWDSAGYLEAGVPLLAGAAAVLGFIDPRRPWRWAAAMFVPQALLLYMFERGWGAFGVTGLLFFSIYAVPAIATGYTGALIRRWLVKQGGFE